jgi:hypothetical protein
MLAPRLEMLLTISTARDRSPGAQWHERLTATSWRR